MENQGELLRQQQRPSFWKTSLNDINEVLGKIAKGKVRTLGHSAGGRPIHLIEYGEHESVMGQANYSSACGAGNPSFYADKTKRTKPVLLIIGGVHGGELEGIAAILNLIQIIEEGHDYRGTSWDYLQQHFNEFRLLVIPCANPDGRARVPHDTMVGMSFDELRYYVQGTWKDGSLCGWPACKTVHPILDHADRLGGYFNDDGVNMAQDNFFSPMAEETRLLLKLAEEEAPDFTIQLHGGTNVVNQMFWTAYLPEQIQQRQRAFDEQLAEDCKRRGMRYLCTASRSDQTGAQPPSFNLASALHHVCGGISMVYETNMALDYGDVIYTYDEILDHHLVLFENMFTFSTKV